VSYGACARKVADPRLPYGRRVTALGGCVQLYRPPGFHATFAYLQHLAGLPRRRETSLLEALRLLSHSRSLLLDDRAAYALARTSASHPRVSPTPTTAPSSGTATPSAAPRSRCGSTCDAGPTPPGRTRSSTAPGRHPHPLRHRRSTAPA
jgi:hypothetical protein